MNISKKTHNSTNEAETLSQKRDRLTEVLSKVTDPDQWMQLSNQITRLNWKLRALEDRSDTKKQNFRQSNPFKEKTLRY